MARKKVSGTQSLIRDLFDYYMDEEIRERMSELMDCVMDAYLQQLKPRHRQVLELYYGLLGNSRSTQQEAGSVLGISGGRVGVIRYKALITLYERDQVFLSLLAQAGELDLLFTISRSHPEKVLRALGGANYRATLERNDSKKLERGQMYRLLILTTPLGMALDGACESLIFEWVVTEDTRGRSDTNWCTLVRR